MQLHELKSPAGSRKRKRIVGRGKGSGSGKRAGRGQTGQMSRAGRGPLLSLEGGQMHLIRRLPKVGFNSKWPKVYQIVNLQDLNRFKSGAVVNAESLKTQGLIKSTRHPVKILSKGEITIKLTIQADRWSKSAEEKIVRAGGTLQPVVVATPQERV